MKPHAWIVTGVLGAALAAGLGAAQPSQPEKQADKQSDRADSRQEFPSDPALAKKYLERRIEETTKREEHFKSLLARREKGEKSGDIGKDLDNGRAGRDTARRTDQDHSAQHTDRPRARLQPEEREQALAFMRENSPALAARFDKLIKSDPEAADRVLGHMIGRIREAEQLKGANPELFRLRIREMEGGAAVVDALRAYREAKSAAPQDLAKLNQATEQLRTALARQFEVRLNLQENEIDSLNKRLADLKADLEKKRSGKDEAIESMVLKVKEGKDLRDGERHEKPGERSAPSTPPARASDSPPQ